MSLPLAVDWMDAFGRFHPVLLHLPIGLLIALAWLRFAKEPSRVVVHSLLCLLALSAVLAATTGWLLHESGTYPDPIEWHEYLGIAVMALSLALVWVHAKKPHWYAASLWATVLLLLPTAHLGASLTHGPDFLTEPWTQELQEEPGWVPPDEGSEQLALIETEFAKLAPILDARCTKCHGERKRKGGLALHSWQGLAQGGDGGEVFVPGNSEASELLIRAHLPLEDEEHMPPEGKPQLSQKDLAFLEYWILSQRPGVWGTAAGLDAPQGTTSVASQPPPGATATPSVAVESAPSPAPDSAVQGLRAIGVHVQPLAEGSSALWVDWSGGLGEPEKVASHLQALAGHIVDLAIPRQPVSAGVMELIGGMQGLRHLDLRGSELAGSLHLISSASGLEVLNLAGAKFPVDTLRSLQKLPALRELIVTDIEVSQENLEGIPASVSVVRGASPTQTALETEPEVQFTKHTEDASSPSETNFNPINAQCPVTGKPVEARFRLVFDDRIIGFCCRHCLAEFTEDPDAYLDNLPKK